VRYKCVKCTAGGVGESSGIDRLTDVPECREDKFPEVPRKEKPLVHNQATLGEWIDARYADNQKPGWSIHGPYCSSPHETYLEDALASVMSG